MVTWVTAGDEDSMASTMATTVVMSGCIRQGCWLHRMATVHQVSTRQDCWPIQDCSDAMMKRQELIDAMSANLMLKSTSGENVACGVAIGDDAWYCGVIDPPIQGVPAACAGDAPCAAGSEKNWDEQSVNDQKSTSRRHVHHPPWFATRPSALAPTHTHTQG